MTMKPRAARMPQFASALLALCFLFAAYSSGAQDDQARQASPSPAAGSDAPRAERLHESDIPALPGLRIQRSGPEDLSAQGQANPPANASANLSAKPSASPSANPPEGPAAQSRQRNGGLSYTVRPGDSLSAIAQLYGLESSELAKVNHLGDDSLVRSGQILQIPNPFAAQARHLVEQLDQETSEAQAARQKGRMDATKIQALTDQLAQSNAANQDLQHGVRVLPWWRGVALTTAAAALLMLGVTALTVLEWLMLRRRFRALVEANDAIRRLDQKYKVALAKAELRLQQLYGRRRSLEDDRAAAKSPDEIEIERLNQQLRELLEQHLERLGFSRDRSARRTRFQNLLDGVEESPVEARATRR